MDTSNTGRVRGGTNTTGFSGGIMAVPGGSYSPEHIPWPTIMSNHRDKMGCTVLSHNIQCGSK